MAQAVSAWGSQRTWDRNFQWAEFYSSQLRHHKEIAHTSPWLLFRLGDSSLGCRGKKFEENLHVRVSVRLLDSWGINKLRAKPMPAPREGYREAEQSAEDSISHLWGKQGSVENTLGNLPSQS